MKWTNLLNLLKFVLASFLGYKLKIFQIHILCYNTKIANDSYQSNNFVYYNLLESHLL